MVAKCNIFKDFKNKLQEWEKKNLRLLGLTENTWLPQTVTVYFSDLLWIAGSVLLPHGLALGTHWVTLHSGSSHGSAGCSLQRFH